ncbi:cathepsin W-like [Pseudophryne corroboree]|uniref:cathepsin W-like n=1 Tax=Pseudophryne corroboree TaxID=495146 RepID=UPI0030814227
MSLLCSLSVLMVIFPHMALGSSELAAFQNFIKEFNKSYKDREEFQYRLSVFSGNLDVANRLGREDLGTAEYGVTKFSDLTDEEFSRNYLNPVSVLPPSTLTESRVEATPVLPSCDWRKAKVISPVRDQGKCGSCWAFASVGNIEAQYAIHGKPMNLSVQQVLDCGPCDAGCKGGYGWDAYMTVLSEDGLVTETDYPYVGTTKHCMSRKLNKVGLIRDFIMLPKNEHEMASYVGKNGTLTVCINATLLQHYKKGVFNPRTCSPNPTHMVLLVGYARDKDVPYWIAKNSWGHKWGENGYLRIARGKNICGITKYPLSAIVSGNQRITCPK